MADSPGSPLSSLGSDDFVDDAETEPAEDLPLPPSKRHKFNPSWDQQTQMMLPENDTETDISSDTDGDVPGSPGVTAQFHDDETGHEQVSYCQWEHCRAGELGDMDKLVEHIHDWHIGPKQKIYSCEWMDCNRKGLPHASGYALRAHMRSHTKEKPFFCQLPECDRSFTRSDALAKHMRTVHETEALRPSDPVPRNHSNAPPRLQRIKLILSAKPPGERSNGIETGSDLGDDSTIADDRDSSPRRTPAFEPYPKDLQLTEQERKIPPKQLYRLLRRQLQWASEERAELQAEVEELEEKRKREWQEKELLLENTLEAEMAHQTLRMGRDVDEQKLKVAPQHDLPLSGETPWYREVEIRRNSGFPKPSLNRFELPSGQEDQA